jgi:Cu/Ag efflux pump CusA
MLDHILRFALKQKMLMILAAVLLLAAGAYSWQKLPIDAFPDVTNIQVMILAEAPGLARTNLAGSPRYRSVVGFLHDAVALLRQ